MFTSLLIAVVLVAVTVSVHTAGWACSHFSGQEVKRKESLR